MRSIPYGNAGAALGLLALVHAVAAAPFQRTYFALEPGASSVSMCNVSCAPGAQLEGVLVATWDTFYQSITVRFVSADALPVRTADGPFALPNLLYRSSRNPTTGFTEFEASDGPCFLVAPGQLCSGFQVGPATYVTGTSDGSAVLLQGGRSPHFTFDIHSRVVPTASTNPLKISGLGGAASIAIADGTYRVNSGPATSDVSIVHNDDSVAVAVEKTGILGARACALLVIADAPLQVCEPSVGVQSLPMLLDD